MDQDSLCILAEHCNMVVTKIMIEGILHGFYFNL